MNDPRLTVPRSTHFVPSVATTSIPLSERFGKVPCHNPLRPNPGVQRIIDELEEDHGSRGAGRPLLQSQRLIENLGLGPGVNKLAVLAAAKDAEILRLKAKLQNAQKHLRTGGGGRNRGMEMEGLKTIQKNSGGGLIFRNRVGGGVSVDRGKKQQLLNFRGQDAAILDLLQPSSSSVGKSPLKRRGKKDNLGKGHVQGKNDDPKSKDDLDDELDAYMSKRKTNLDKELDNYMSVARSKYLTARAKAQANETSQEPAVPATETDSTSKADGDAELIIDEEDIEAEGASMETE